MKTPPLREALQGRILRGRFRVRVLVAIGAGLWAMCGTQAQSALTKVVAEGDPIQGLAGVTISSVGNATLTSGGGVVAIVWLIGTGVTSTNDRALVSAAPGGPVQLMARAGDPVTGPGVPAGSTVNNVDFSSGSDIAASDTGVVARQILINVPGLGVKVAILAGGLGSMSIQVYGDQPMPALGTGVKINELGEPQVSRSGEITYSSVSSGPYVIWRGPPGGMAIAARTGVQYPGLPGPGKFSSLHWPVINETGDLCFRGVLEKDNVVVTDGNRERLWKAGPPFVELTNAGQTIPDGGTLRDYRPLAMRGPWAAVNASNPPAAASPQFALVMVQPGTAPSVLMRTGQNAPDESGAPIAPVALRSPDIRHLPTGVAILSPRLEIGGAVNGNNDQGVWRWDGSTLRLLAREGSDIPNLPGRRWTTMENGMIDASGRGVFSARVSGPSPTNPLKTTWYGVWAGSNATALELLAEDGQPIALGGGATAATNNFGRLWAVKDADILVSVIFTPAGSLSRIGVALVGTTAAPVTGAVAGQVRIDFDGDGDLQDADLPVPGVTIELLARDLGGNPTGSVRKTATSAGNGTYGFDEVAPGPYIVRGIITPVQATAGLSWTSPAVASVAVTRIANVTAGTTVSSLDFLATTPIRPDHTNDENDGDIGIGRQSLREAFARAQQKATGVTIDLGPASYRLSSALILAGPNPEVITLRTAEAGQAILDGEGQTPIMVVAADRRLRTEQITFKRGITQSLGGAVFNGGRFEAVRCDFVGCEAILGGGGAIYNQGLATVHSCDFVGNTARGTPDHQGERMGGAILTTGTSAALTVVNSHFVSNFAKIGGALCVAGGRADLRHSTVFFNEGKSAGGGIFVVEGATLTLQNTLMARNDRRPSEDPQAPLIGDDIDGTVTSLGFNLIQFADRALFAPQTSDILGKDSKMSLLGEGLQPDSPAINAGDPNFDPGTLLADQRGHPRVVGGRIDIGALEFSGTPADWSLSFFGDAVVKDQTKEATHWGPAADPDTDGVTNFLERAFGGDPTNPSLQREDGAPVLPEVEKAGAAVDFRFALDERYVDLRYIVQASSDAAPWLDAATFVPLGGGLGFRRDSAPGSPTTPGIATSSRSRFLINEMLPIQPGQKHLLRLKVVGSP